MKLLILSFSLIFLMGCQNDNQTQKKSMYHFYIGTYTNSDSKGIYQFTLSDEGKLLKKGLVAQTNNPSFLAKSVDQKYLLAVNEIDSSGTGTVESYLIQKDKLQFLSKSITGGAHPCHLNINNDGDVIIANYTGGNVGLLKLDDSGKLSDLLFKQQHEGKGISDRQKGPHAHSAWFEPNSKNIIAVDLGTNELWFSKVNASSNELKLNESSRLKMVEGAGPRHLTFHPSKKWIYVLNELNSTVSLITKNQNEQYQIISSESTLPKNYKGENLGADIHISSDGKFLYASNRGHNSIVIYSINQENGSLKYIAHEPVKGNWPRNFSLSPDNKFLIVANQFSNNLVSFTRNEQTGLLKYVDEIDAPAPVCILF